MTSPAIKTIYDPSPVGYKVPYSEPFMSIVNNAGDYNITFTPTVGSSVDRGFSVHSISGESIFFHAFSYRSGSTGDLASGDYASYWLGSASVTNGHVAMFQNVADSPRCQLVQDPLFHGFSVRPILE